MTNLRIIVSAVFIAFAAAVISGRFIIPALKSIRQVSTSERTARRLTSKKRGRLPWAA